MVAVGVRSCSPRMQRPRERVAGGEGTPRREKTGGLEAKRMQTKTELVQLVDEERCAQRVLSPAHRPDSDERSSREVNAHACIRFEVVEVVTARPSLKHGQPGQVRRDGVQLEPADDRPFLVVFLRW